MDDKTELLPGTLDEAALTRRLAATDAVVIMKVGRNLPKIRRALEAANRLGEAVYVERGTMKNESMVRLSERDDSEAPYFSLILVPGWREKL